jgi:hypothetical protein
LKASKQRISAIVADWVNIYTDLMTIGSASSSDGPVLKRQHDFIPFAGSSIRCHLGNNPQIAAKAAAPDSNVPSPLRTWKFAIASSVVRPLPSSALWTEKIQELEFLQRFAGGVVPDFCRTQ